MTTIPVSAIIWFYFLAAALLVYVVLDGFDLGMGILTLFNRDSEYMKTAVDNLRGVWHANQTWLVVVGATLFGAFPLAYGLILSVLYIPVILMLIGLIGRGIALEYYYETGGNRLAVLAFGWGSLLAAVMQGLGVGTLLAGIPTVNGQFIGGVWHWLSPFPLVVGLGLPVFYTLLGATRLISASENVIEQFCRKAVKITAPLALAAAAVVLIWGFASKPLWAAAWLNWPQAAATLGLLILGAVVIILLIVGATTKNNRLPFIYAAAATWLIGLGLANGLFPWIVPPDISIFQAMADPMTLEVMMVGLGITLPLIVLYTAYMYSVFKKPKENN